MAERMLGKEVNVSLGVRIAAAVDAAREAGRTPCLEIIRIGENGSDLSYERGAEKRCEKYGILVKKAVFPEDVEEDAVFDEVRRVSQDPSVTGVLLFRPLPKRMNASRIENALDPAKDVDCMTDLSMSGVFQGKQLGFPPCTAQAVMEILDHYGIDPKGKRAVVIGRSLVIGRPVAMMLMQRNATVTICHTRTGNMAEIARQADILVAAAGHAGVVTADFMKEGAIIIDVGINVAPDGNLCGDVSYGEAEEKAGMITPVPGGVGAVTTSVLALHTAEAAQRQASRH